ncbi:unnamed protein product [Pieris macdunnoughi]|uniref:Uncharacterized protein n=1 Tax=Pieris macdunnoughi TaxID=345717 RepID=A0A821KZE1_9NEOP|nr:unnamed protein product [Pieris macdunnoughi]
MTWSGLGRDRSGWSSTLGGAATWGLQNFTLNCKKTVPVHSMKILDPGNPGPCLLHRQLTMKLFFLPQIQEPRNE